MEFLVARQYYVFGRRKQNFDNGIQNNYHVRKLVFKTMFVYNVVKWCLIVVTVIPDIEPTGDGRGIQERKFDALRSRSNVAAVVDYPFLVGLMSDSGTAEHDDNVTAVCTGTLVTSVFVLSSAYCTSRFHIGIKVGIWCIYTSYIIMATCGLFFLICYSNITYFMYFAYRKREILVFHYSL